MTEQLVKVMVMVDGTNAAYVEITAKRWASGMLQSTLEHTEISDTPRDVIVAALGMLLSEVQRSNARFTHATGEKTGDLRQAKHVPALPPGA